MPVQHPSVGVLLATYNGANHLDEQLSSIASQLDVRVQVCLRDDGSTDDTVAIAQRMLPSDQLRIVDPQGEPCGLPSGNFFKLLLYSPLEEYDYVCFADQDDIWTPSKLRRAITRMRESGAGAYSSDLIAFHARQRTAWHLRKAQPQRSYDYLFQGASAGCTYVLTKSTALLIRERIDRHWDSLPARASHDWLIYAICRSAQIKWHMDTEASVFYRQHAANAFGALPSASGLAARLRLSRSGWYRQHILGLKPFLELTREERIILDAVDRMSWGDRLLLARRVNEFRRLPKDAALLRGVILAGML